MTNNAPTDFLTDIKENKIAVTVFLINGVKLQGIITFFDDNSFLLRCGGYQTFRQRFVYVCRLAGVNLYGNGCVTCDGAVCGLYGHESNYS